MSTVSRELLRANSSTNGVILWLKPGVSRDIKPEPIHLRETIAFMRDNCEYESSGHDSYDIYHQDEAYQFDKIVEQLKPSWEPPEGSMINLKYIVEPLIIQLTEAFLSTPSAERTIVLNTKQLEKNTKQLEKNMTDINSTAASIFADVDKNKISARNCSGKLFSSYINS